METSSIGVALLTLNAEKHLDRLLSPLLNSPLKPEILVVDSSSTDSTAEFALKKGVDVIVIHRKDFNHGTTREKARKWLNTPIVVFLTQDAYLTDEQALEKLVRPLLEKKAALSYARQIPRPHANPFEAFARAFNYPSKSHIRTLQDLKEWGVYTYFCSNSCAAYLNESLDRIGGFQKVLLGEDALACAQLLHDNQSVAYTAECLVEHSHNYTLLEEFKRHFDIGLSRASLSDFLDKAGSDSSRGRLYAIKLLKWILLQSPFLLPYALLHLMAKWTGYHLGKKSQPAPHWWKRALSSQPYYYTEGKN